MWLQFKYFPIKNNPGFKFGKFCEGRLRQPAKWFEIDREDFKEQFLLFISQIETIVGVRYRKVLYGDSYCTSLLFEDARNIRHAGSS
jgi:hypothetical protein